MKIVIGCDPNAQSVKEEIIACEAGNAESRG